VAESRMNFKRQRLPFDQQGEHLARRQELIGYKRGGDRKSSAFSKAQNEPLKTTAEIAHNIWHADKN